MNGRDDYGTPTTTIDRIRRHLQLSGSRSATDGSVTRDLRTIIGRLSKARARGVEFQGVELSAHVRDEANRLQLLGSELLVLDPNHADPRSKRKRA